jgi:hypothetical protein
MPRLPCPWLLLTLLPSGCGAAEVRLGQEFVVVFASPEHGRRLLSQRDDFVRRLSPFDRAVRMKTDAAVGEEEFLAFAASSVLAWTPDERTKVERAIDAVNQALVPFSLDFPEVVYFVKTNGEEEGGAAYTRGSAVVLPHGFTRRTQSRLEHIIAHELLHVLSRHDSVLRESLYRAIGFKKCNEITLPAGLERRRITNPDAPRNDHYVEVTCRGERVCVVPIILAESEYDAQSRGRFFDQLMIRLLRINERDGGAWEPMYEGSHPVLLKISDVAGFYEQVGRNTGYIVHPEEIVAENFASIATNASDVRSPEVLERIAKVLREKKPTDARVHRLDGKK